MQATAGARAAGPVGAPRCSQSLVLQGAELRPPALRAAAAAAPSPRYTSAMERHGAGRPGRGRCRALRERLGGRSFSRSLPRPLRSTPA